MTGLGPRLAGARIPPWASRVGLLLLWMKAISLSSLVWAFGFCFLLMGLALPWRPMPAINAVLLLIAALVWLGAYRLDKLIWGRYQEARRTLRNSSN